MDTITPIKTVTKTLRWDGHSDEAIPSTGEKIALNASLFGHLVRLVVPSMEMFQSDLFHDALWIDRNVTYPGTFLYGYTTCHTSIAEDSVAGHSYVWGFNDTVLRVETHTTPKRAWAVHFHILKAADLNGAVAGLLV